MKTMPQPKGPPPGAWVMTERAAHEAFAELITRSPLAAKLMHILVARLGQHNAVVVSQGVLADLAGATRRGIQKALAVLEQGRWIEVRQIGERATVNAYVINDRVAWFGDRDGRRFALFSASIIVSADEQPDADRIGDPHLMPLRKLPVIYQDEQQLPTGPGLDPPSQMLLSGMEPELPAIGAGDTPAPAPAKRRRK